jgi:putative flippase GtrA
MRMSETLSSAYHRLPRAGGIGARLSLSVQFCRYALCAGLAAAVNFGVGSALVALGCTSSLGFPAAVAMAYGCGMAVNFWLNRHLTFVSDRRGIDQARTFVAVALSGLVFTTAVAAFARAGLLLVVPALPVPAELASPETLSRVIAIGVTSVFSFAGHKYLTFGRGIRPALRRLLQRAG